MPSPTTFGEFTSAFTPMLERLVEHVERTELLGRLGWSQQLAGYCWNAKEPGWLDGVASRHDNARAVQAMLEGTRTFEDVFDRVVRQWGGINQGLDADSGARVISTIGCLAEAPDHIVTGPMFMERIASVSKLYAASAPTLWVIYDSRVAAAMTYLIAATGHLSLAGHLFGTLPGKSPSRLRILPGFPRIWPTSHELAYRSFVHASWACRAIAGLLERAGIPLPDGAPGPWMAFHVEMALFMLGQDLRDLPRLPDGVAPPTGQLMLGPGRLFAWHMFPGYVEAPYCSPILVRRVRPLKQGDGTLELSFLNCFYAEGVQDLTKQLRVIRQAPDHLVAIELPESMGRTVVISPLSEDWMEQHGNGWSLHDLSRSLGLVDPAP